MPVERQVVSIWAGTTGELDVVPVTDIRRFETEFLEYVGREHKDIFDSIAESKQLSDDTADALRKAVADFKGQFETGAGEGLQLNEAEADTMNDEDVGQEKVTVYKKKK